MDKIIRIGLVGYKESGKTSFIATLPYAYSSQGSSTTLTPYDDSTLSFVLDVMNSFLSGYVLAPSDGETVYKMSFKYQKGFFRRRTIIDKVEIMDVPGEKFDPVSGLNKEVFMRFLDECQAILYLVDGECFTQSDQEANLSNANKYHSLIRTLDFYLTKKNESDLKSGSTKKIFIAFCITKADVLEDKYKGSQNDMIEDILNDYMPNAYTEMLNLSKNNNNITTKWYMVSSFGYQRNARNNDYLYYNTDQRIRIPQLQKDENNNIKITDRSKIYPDKIIDLMEDIRKHVDRY